MQHAGYSSPVVVDETVGIIRQRSITVGLDVVPTPACGGMRIAWCSRG